jgi:hypothetical protein
MRTAGMQQVAATIGNMDSDWNEDRSLQIKSSHEKGIGVAAEALPACST